VANNDTWNESFDEFDGSAVVFRRPKREADEVDMTPMIDCVFLLLIFFLVGTIPDVKTAVELAPARYGTGADPHTSTIVTIADRGSPGPALVYLADGKIGAPLPDDPKVQQAAVTAAVKKGSLEGKTSVLVKAERSVKHREVSRVATAAGAVEGIRLYLAVFEIR
jgi:biopolymer transport protein ExbD